MQNLEPPEISSGTQELRKREEAPTSDFFHLSICPPSPQVSAFSFQVSSATSPLLPILFDEIDAAGGTISFRRFMEQALYHPEHGYYASGRARIGKNGDFFTSVSVGRIYGRLLASICREVWERLDSPTEFSIVEQGANDGTLAADILSTLTHTEDAFSKAVRYRIVEPFAINREHQQQKLSSFSQLSWFDSLEELPLFTGIHLSNELLDAFPIHSLRWTGAAWEEECVERNNDELLWTTSPICQVELSHAAELLPKNLPAGFRVEVNLEIRSWLRTIQSRMERGIILTVDYGQVGEDRYAPHRADGTLLAYQNHERFHDPLPEPGMRDVTAQVDFTALAREAKNADFDILGYSDQHHFLMGAAEPWLRSLGDSAPDIQKDLGALQTLLHPGIMGMQFKAIAFGKGFPTAHPLCCLRYQRPGVGILS